jgi:hypothetical protein
LRAGTGRMVLRAYRGPIKSHPYPQDSGGHSTSHPAASNLSQLRNHNSACAIDLRLLPLLLPHASRKLPVFQRPAEAKTVPATLPQLLTQTILAAWFDDSNCQSRKTIASQEKYCQSRIVSLKSLTIRESSGLSRCRCALGQRRNDDERNAHRVAKAARSIFAGSEVPTCCEYGVGSPCRSA